MQEEPIPPIEINSKIPSAINDIILKAMRKDTTLRYQSATEMLRDLNRALKDPQGDFVDNTQYVDEEATRKVPTLNGEEIKTEKIEKNKKENFFIKHKRLSILLGVIVLFFLSIFGTRAFLKATSPKEVAIPNVVGKTREEAEKIIADSKLILGEVKEEYNTEIETGKIISQDPVYRENYNIKEGTTISFVISLGIEEATVPKVVGMTEEEAIKALEEAKLKYEIKEENSKKVEAGYVIEQETEPEKKVNAGDTVIIHVSTGIKKIAVPSVLGKSESDATKELKNAGFKVITNIAEDRSQDDGSIIKQSIDAGTEVEDGTSITITINKHKTIKSIPVTINVKSLLGNNIEYEEKKEIVKDEEGNETEKITKIPKNVVLKIKVGDEIKYTNNSVDPTANAIPAQISGVGTVDVHVMINSENNVVWEKTVNLNEIKSLTIK